MVDMHDPRSKLGMFLILLSYQIDFAVTTCESGATDEPFALVVDSSAIRKVMLASGVVTTIDQVESEYYGAAISPDGRFCIVSVKLQDNNKTLKIIHLWNNTFSYPKYMSTNLPIAAYFSEPAGLAISPDGEYALLADTSGKIRKVDFQQNTVNPSIAGKVTGSVGNNDGLGTVASFNFPADVAISPDGNFALVADRANHRIRKIEMSTSMVSTLCGDNQGYRDGRGTNALFSLPFSVVISPDGSFALVADSGNNCIRKISLVASATVSTVAVGSGYTGQSSSSFFSPKGISISSDGTFALVADSGNKRICRIDLISSVVTTIGIGSETASGFISPLRAAISPLGTCSLCRAGTYSIGNICTECHGGTYATGLGATNISACEKCEASKASGVVGGASDSICTHCLAGEFSAGGASFCSKCDSGSFATSGSTVCAICGPGTFSSVTGASACSACWKGSYSSLIGAKESSTCSKCETGKYSTASGATDSQECKSCALGKYFVSSLGDCVFCPAGTFSSSIELTCARCNGGTFSTVVGATSGEVCTTCSAGTYSDISTTSCSVCVAGEYSARSMTACSTCIRGYFSSSSGASICAQCPAGSFSIGGMGSCTECEIGFYGSSNGISTCTRCEPGTYSSVGSATTCNLCAPGLFSLRGVCEICTAGTYSSLWGASTCEICKAGTFSTVHGSLNESSCTPCGQGKFSDVTGAATGISCQDCQPGMYSSVLVATACQSCAICPGIGTELVGCNASFNAICKEDLIRLSAKYVFAFAPISISGFATCAFLKLHSVPIRPNRRWLGSIFVGANNLLSNFSLLVLLNHDEQSVAFAMILVSMLTFVALCVCLCAFRKEPLWLLLTSSTDVKPNFNRSTAIANKVMLIVIAGVPSLIVQIWLLIQISSMKSLWLDWLIWIQSSVFSLSNLLKNGYDLQTLCSFDLEKWVSEQQQEQNRSAVGISFTQPGAQEFSRIEEVDYSSKDSCSESVSLSDQEKRKLSSISERRNVEIGSICDISIELEPVTEFQDSFDDFEPSVLRSNQTPKKGGLRRTFEESQAYASRSPFEPDFEQVSDLFASRVQRSEITLVVEECSPSKRKAE